MPGAQEATRREEVESSMIDSINFLLSVAGETDSPSFSIQHDAFVPRFSANLPLIIVHLEDAAPGSNRSTAIKRSSGAPRHRGSISSDISDARKEHSRNFAICIRHRRRHPRRTPHNLYVFLSDIFFILSE